ncbi:MAG: extracellular solute-binding protein [Christensenellales bacterium]|jgi:putative aldouronate transport system substrate-binding protein
MKKLLSIALALALLLTIASATAEVTVNKANEFPITSEVVSFDVWMEGGAGTDYSTNGWLQEVEDITNVHVDIITSSSADALNKRNLLLASGDYPDMFLTDWTAIFSQADVMQFGVKEGILTSISPFLEDYGYEINSIFEYNPIFKLTSTAPDGEIYGVARFSECYHCSAYPKMYMRQDWLEAVNMAMPTTTEELREVLRAFVTNDLNGNGEADEIGLTGATTWNTPVQWCLIGWSFQAVKPNFWLYLTPEGEVDFSCDTEAYREGIRYCKSLYDEGLIDPAAFSQKEDQMAQTVRQEPKICGAYVCDHCAMGVSNADYDEYKNYQIVLPVEGPSGRRVQPQNANEGEVQGFHAVITDVCEYPAAAFRWLDYHLSEDSMVKKGWGKEGIGWEVAPEGTLDLFGNPAKYIRLNTDEEQNPEAYAENVAYQFWIGPQADLAARRLSQLPMVEDVYLPENYEQRISLDTVPLEAFIDPNRLPATLFVAEADADEFTEIRTNLNDYITKATVQFIIGERDIDADWDAYLNDLARYGIDRYVEIYSAAYQSSLG